MAAGTRPGCPPHPHPHPNPHPNPDPNQDFHAQLELQLDAEKNDLHLDNLTGLNDMVGAAVSWAAPRRPVAAAEHGAQKHGGGPQEEKKARTA